MTPKGGRCGESLQVIQNFPHFMGYRFGLFNFATKAAGGFVDYDYLRLSDKITALRRGFLNDYEALARAMRSREGRHAES